jgi:hypothetical protein
MFGLLTGEDLTTNKDIITKWVFQEVEFQHVSEDAKAING